MPQKILVIDDEEDIVYMLKSTLEKNGFEVITAADGEQALRLIKTDVPDLMITDLTMPVMSGWHFSMKVRGDPRFKTTPIIILSALLDIAAESEKSEAAIFYVPKPFDILKLMDKIKEILK